MRRKIVSAIAVIAVLVPAVWLAAGEPNVEPEPNRARLDTSEAGQTARRPKPRIDAVTITDFYMRDGNSVSGRLISDDKNQIVIEQLLESTLVTRTYTKREIDTRTLSTRPLAESKYYTQLAEYFAARTWDFRDDPDDFIQAIRCYEKAKQSLEATGADDERLAEADRAVRKLQDDREVWTREVESRAKLKKLEYDAEAENRLKQLERRVAESNAKLNESIKYLDQTAEDMKSNYEKVEKIVAGLNKDFVQQIQYLQAQITDNRAAINDLSYRLFLTNRPPAPGGR